MSDHQAEFDKARKRVEERILASVALPESVLRRSGEPSLMPPIATPDYVPLDDLRRRATECFAYAMMHPWEAARKAEREQQEYETAMVVVSVSGVSFIEARPVVLALEDELKLPLPELRRRLMRGDDGVWKMVESNLRGYAD